MEDTTPETGLALWGTLHRAKVSIVQSRARFDLEHKHHDSAGGGRESSKRLRRQHCSSLITSSPCAVDAFVRCYGNTEGDSRPRRSEQYREPRGGLTTSITSRTLTSTEVINTSRKSWSGTVCSPVVGCGKRYYAGQSRYRTSFSACPCSMLQ